jgi:hypothetical protein
MFLQESIHLQRWSFWSRNLELKPIYFPVSSSFLPTHASRLNTVFLVDYLVFFQVSPVCLLSFLFLKGDSSLVFLSFCKKWLQFRASGPEEVTTSSEEKTVTTFIGTKKPASGK